MSDSTLQATVAAARVLDVPLESYPPTLEQVIEGELEMRAAVLWKSEDGTAATGVWQCPPVKLSLEHPFDETFVVLEGAMTITPESGEPRRLEAGDAIVIPLGTTNVWEIHETVTKVFSVHDSRRLPI
jgi:uncharacterized cupin superfamily protein